MGAQGIGENKDKKDIKGRVQAGWPLATEKTRADSRGLTNRWKRRN